jgi:hypothetical protein
VKEVVDLTHPIFVGFSLGFNLGNLLGRAIDLIDQKMNWGWFHDDFAASSEQECELPQYAPDEPNT